VLEHNEFRYFFRAFHVKVDNIHFTNFLVDIHNFCDCSLQVVFKQNYFVNQFLLSVFYLIFTHEILPQRQITPLLLLLEEFDMHDVFVECLLFSELLETVLNDFIPVLMRNALFGNCHEFCAVLSLYHPVGHDSEVVEIRSGACCLPEVMLQQWVYLNFINLVIDT